MAAANRSSGGWKIRYSAGPARPRLKLGPARKAEMKENN